MRYALCIHIYIVCCYCSSLPFANRFYLLSELDLTAWGWHNKTINSFVKTFTYGNRLFLLLLLHLKCYIVLYKNVTYTRMCNSKYLPVISIEYSTTMLKKKPLFLVERCCTVAGKKCSKDNMMCLLYVTLTLSFFPKWRSSSCIIPSNTFLRPLFTVSFFFMYYFFSL